MPGFPNRIRRASLGPTLQDVWPVTDERKAIAARSFNLAWWQLAGAALTAAQGLLSIKLTGTSPGTVFQAFAFDPDGALPLLAWTRSAAGVYSYSFPQSQYADEQGNLVTLVLNGGIATPQTLVSGNALRGSHELTGARAGTVRFETVGGTLTDIPSNGTFLVQLF